MSDPLVRIPCVCFTQCSQTSCNRLCITRSDQHSSTLISLSVWLMDLSGHCCCHASLSTLPRHMYQQAVTQTSSFNVKSMYWTSFCNRCLGQTIVHTKLSQKQISSLLPSDSKHAHDSKHALKGVESTATKKKHAHTQLTPSSFCIQNILEAPADSPPTVTYTLCDVRDVAKAHVLAAETQSASGRYIVSNATRLDAHDITEILKVWFQTTCSMEIRPGLLQN